MPEEPDFSEALVAVPFAFELVEPGFVNALGPDFDFDAVETFGFESGFAMVPETVAARFPAGADFPDDVAALAGAALAGATGFTGETGFVGIVAIDFLPASTFSGRETSFAAGGLFGFLFGGNCNSAKRSMTSAMHCSVSA